MRSKRLEHANQTFPKPTFSPKTTPITHFYPINNQNLFFLLNVVICLRCLYFSRTRFQNKKRISNLHTKPYGCHFMSNNKWLSMYYYLVYRDEGLGCLWESSNPNVRIKYSVTLKTFVNAPEQGRCILGD